MSGSWSGRIMGRCRQPAPPFGSITSSLLAGVSRSPHKSGSSLASHPLRPVAGGKGRLPGLVLRTTASHQSRPTLCFEAPRHGPPRFASRPVLPPPLRHLRPVGLGCCAPFVHSCLLHSLPRPLCLWNEAQHRTTHSGHHASANRTENISAQTSFSWQRSQ